MNMKNTQDTTLTQNANHSQKFGLEKKLSLSSVQDNEHTQRIYVASLSDYNAGFLHGEWIDLEGHDMDSLHETIKAILAKSPAMKLYGDPAEEWAIHDFEGFGSYRLSEYEDLERVLELHEAAQEHEGDIFFGVLAYYGGDLDHTLSQFEDNFNGTWESVEAYAENFLEETGTLDTIPQHLQAYFDVKSYAQDMELGGDITAIEITHDKHAIFWSRWKLRGF